jgi:3-dehydroquinate dehydratase I
LQIKPLICVPILEKDLNSLSKSAEKAIKLGADMVEFRIDALQNPDPDKIRDLTEKTKHKIIATNRIQQEGGFFQGSEEERTDILIEVAEYVDFVDIELQTPDKYRSKVLKASKSSIVSFHDFQKTPDVEELLKVVGREQELGDIAKFAVMPLDLPDTLVVLEVLSQVSNTIGISMGQLGRYTRLIAPLFGSPITFASVDTGSAPGQLDIETTKNFVLKLLNNP